MPRCRIDDDIILELNGDFSPAMTSNSFDSNASLLLSDCMVRCWNDCSCLGFMIGGNNNDTGCLTWTGTKSVNNFTFSSQTSVRPYVLISPTKGE